MILKKNYFYFENTKSVLLSLDKHRTKSIQITTDSVHLGPTWASGALIVSKYFDCGVKIACF